MRSQNKQKNTVLNNDDNQNISHHQHDESDPIEPKSSRKTVVREYPMKGRAPDEETINLNELLYFFWDKRIYIYKIIGGFVLLGLLVALLTPVEYEASSTLLPESESSQGVASSLLNQYGGLLGLGGGNISGETITPSLYPDIVKSLPYQAELMNTEIYFEELDSTLTPHQYFRDLYTPSVFTYLKRYTLGLPGQIVSLFSDNRNLEDNASILSEINRDGVTSLSNVELKTIRELQERIIITQEENLVTLTAEMPDARASAELGQVGIELLKEYVREYRTQKAKNELEFVQEQVNETEKRFQVAQNRLAEFRDSNVNLATAKARSREQELQSEYDLAFDLYNSLSQNLEQAKIRVQENTPVFTTVEPIIVPKDPSTPNVKLILVIFIFTGFIVSLGFVILKNQWDEFHEYLLSRSDIT